MATSTVFKCFTFVLLLFAVCHGQGNRETVTDVEDVPPTVSPDPSSNGALIGIPIPVIILLCCCCYCCCRRNKEKVVVVEEPVPTSPTIIIQQQNTVAPPPPPSHPSTNYMPQHVPPPAHASSNYMPQHVPPPYDTQPYPQQQFYARAPPPQQFPTAPQSNYGTIH